MTPLLYLLLTLAVLIGAVLVDQTIRRRRHRALADLARQWRMHFISRDVFQMTRRCAPRFPIPGAADLRITDLIYGIEGDSHRYIFSAEFTLGVVRSRKRDRRVGCCREPRAHSNPDEPTTEIELADADLSLIEQYRQLYHRTPTAIVAPTD